ncbi:hypothetical protein J3E68DRAFT_394712 [Trichoderma sp. SZMC 28012]
MRGNITINTIHVSILVQQPSRGGAGKKRRRQRHRPRLEASLCRWLSAPQDPPCDIQASRDPTSGPD